MDTIPAISFHSNFSKAPSKAIVMSACVGSVFPLTVTLNWDTEMLFGWTLRRTHCLMLDAKRRGSNERSHFSFLVHLQKKRERERNGIMEVSEQKHTHRNLVMRPECTCSTCWHLEKENVPLFSKRWSWLHLSYFLSCSSLATVVGN